MHKAISYQLDLHSIAKLQDSEEPIKLLIH